MFGFKKAKRTKIRLTVDGNEKVEVYLKGLKLKKESLFRDGIFTDPDTELPFSIPSKEDVVKDIPHNLDRNGDYLNWVTDSRILELLTPLKLKKEEDFTLA